ncbi:hypothetical protein MAR_005362 [Mya arenaria]|uniref:Uncharacterized protein n=1 Tax=Mya arenaria TaxID=6604 RepID=A0ABY7F0Z7_MYAAR|nr:hypothetical protein MAR_005362 [Mya arenaria]
MVIRLDGFHTPMSFLCCIGHIMQNSGLQELIETVYAPNIVTHILSGKEVPWLSKDILLSIASLLKVFFSTGLSAAIFTSESMAHGCSAEMTHELQSSLGSNRTAHLWLLYMDMVAILKRFIKAVRTGNWELHLMTMKEVLPFVAVAVIEQVLMRRVKFAGGLTRGRGMAEIQRIQWLLSMPACSDVNTAIHKFTGPRYETSDLIKDVHGSRTKNSFLRKIKAKELLEKGMLISTRQRALAKTF